MVQKTVRAKEIVERKGVCGGVPILAGTRIRVSDIVVEYDHNGLAPEQIAREFPGVTIADIFSALKYYYENPAKIRKEIENRERLLSSAAAAKHN
ncbi:MAG: DUF433 domain-containing protein [Candidatus Aenigmarchaeota archaeon]|nr:DUF433 domain-containing protein [Candidatus Aenigmarchaeota archaeon]